jgi:hypothetical protein
LDWDLGSKPDRPDQGGIAPQNWTRSATDYALWLNLRTQTNFAFEKSGLVVVEDLMEHYLSAKGTDFTVNYDKLISDNTTVDSYLNILTKMAAQNLDAKISGTSEVTVSTQTWHNLYATENGWMWAINGFHTAGEGKAKCVNKNGKTFIELRVKYYLSDLYDFENDPDAFAGFRLSDADWHRMHRVGLAKEFYVNGTSKEYTLTWEKGSPQSSGPLPPVGRPGRR